MGLALRPDRVPARTGSGSSAGSGWPRMRDWPSRACASGSTGCGRSSRDAWAAVWPGAKKPETSVRPVSLIS